jgi:hypothetical protein
MELIQFFRCVPSLPRNLGSAAARCTEQIRNLVMHRLQSWVNRDLPENENTAARLGSGAG